jgi:hypothetical protein
MQITTNHQARELISAFELPTANYNKLRKQFDYLDDQDFDSSMFFTYKGEIYCLADFIRLDGDLLAKGWQGIYNWHAFGGLVVKIKDSCQSVVVGTYTC